MTRFIRHHRTTRRWLVSVVTAGAVIVSMVAIYAQADQFQLFVVASDANGAPVNDLKVEDVSMAESGMPGKVLTVERANLPIKLTIVVDNGPDSDRLLEYYRTGLTALADALPPDLEVTLYTSAPAPRLQVKPSVDRMELKRAFTRIGRDGEDPRFSDSIVEYSQRLEKEAKELKVPYMPALILLSTIAGDPTSYQLGDIEKAIALIQQRGGKSFVAVSTSKLNDNEARTNLTIGRQGTIGAKLAKKHSRRLPGAARPEGAGHGAAGMGQADSCVPHQADHSVPARAAAARGGSGASQHQEPRPANHQTRRQAISRERGRPLLTIDLGTPSTSRCPDRLGCVPGTAETSPGWTGL